MSLSVALAGCPSGEDDAVPDAGDGGVSETGPDAGDGGVSETGPDAGDGGVSETGDGSVDGGSVDGGTGSGGETSSADDEATSGEEGEGDETGGVELPPFEFAPVYGVPNLDDDDENGDADWYQVPFTADDDLSTLTVPGLPEGYEVVLSFDEVPVPIRLWAGNEFILGVASATLDEYVLAPGPSGAVLGVEFGDYAAGASLNATLLDPSGSAVASTTILLQSSPLIMNHHLQPTEHVWVVGYNGSGGNTAMTNVYAEVLGSRFTLIPGTLYDQPYEDPWIQDEIEFATSTGSAGQRLNTVIDSIRDRELDAFAEDMVVRPDFIARAWGNPNQATTFDSFGNLEASPPVTVDGVQYPFGRIYYGRQGNWGLHTQLAAQLEAQQVQKPFQLDTTWLCVGHVDEFSSFVPDPSSPKGFKLLLSDTRAGYELLETLSPGMELTRYAQDHGYSTVGSILEDSALRALNEDMQEFNLDPIRQRFKDELDLTDADIIEVPGIFERAPNCGGYVVSLIPGTVNLIVANPEGEGTHLFVPDPFFRTNLADQASDPVLQDFAARMPDGLQVHFVDDWDVYHMGLGEVHCGTNVQRTPIAQWWTTAMHLLGGQ